MRYRMRSSILIITAGASWLQSLGAWGQRIRLDDPTIDPTSINQNSAESPFIPDEALISPGDEILQQQQQQQQQVEEDTPEATENLAINRTDTNPTAPPEEQAVPISALLFAGPPGPKACRGPAILSISLTKPGAQHTTPKCYNVPGVAQCGNFVANKDDGCEARIFAEPDCRIFSNLAVFIPETRPFGGYVRSIEVRCGVVSTTPPPLNLPGLKLPAGAMQAVG
ncbi:hypothetical protein GGR51DRAFT_523087 [Nemania sp. FL0031]|nr:hypothetical protein GGR51DRAFT_523087 [Nemania sp. FL0031]